MTRKLSFKEADLVRALKAAIKAKLKVTGFEVDAKGTIIVRTTEEEKPETGNPRDKALGNEAR